MLHKLLLSSMALIGLTGFASGADLDLKAAPIAPIYVPTWTGCYVGGHAGYGKEESNDQYTNLQTYNIDATPMTNNYSNQGFAGGGQVGCQLQTGTFLWGIEGDLTSFKNSDSKSFSTQYEDNYSKTYYNSSTDLSVDKSYLWSVRGRFGVINSDVYHLYATMGIGGEKGSYNYSDTHICAATGPGICAADSSTFTATTAGTIAIRSTGLVVGAGAEWKILPYIVLRAEYLHYAIAKDAALPQNNLTNAGYVTGPGLGDHVHFGNLDVVRVGVSWLFNFGL
jgi:outer membrane immunogenic protein